jgi:type IV fimbrial biogenesis protein FimT
MNEPNCRLTPYSSNRGFTLIEMMVTVIVLAILTAAALPSFRSFIAGQRIKSASFDIMSSMMLARSEAIKRNADVDVKPVSGSWLNGWTVAVSASGATLSKQSALSSALTITCYSGAATVTPCPTVTYNSNGRLSIGAAPAIQLSSTSTTGIATRCIGIDLSGRPNSKKAGCP